MTATELINYIVKGVVLDSEDIKEIGTISAEEIKQAVIERFKLMYVNVLLEELERRKATKGVDENDGFDT